LNPFGATVGPPEQGNPAPAGAPAQPAWPGEAAYAPTTPPTEEPARVAVPPYAAPLPPPQPVAPLQAPAPAPPTRPSTHPVAAAADPELVDPHAPRALAGFLVSYEGNELGVFYPIYQGQNLVGRKGAAPGLHIEIEHGTTSSRHATLFASARPGRMKIEDMGSTNGTFVGDLMLERGKKHELKDGDVVRFGGYVTIIKIV
jgi:pSer/pThr/pTyr-binding forkhead associated (FHA) protein